ncbi:15457_t:CDS:2, partial [Dentiscutata erythropus]
IEALLPESYDQAKQVALMVEARIKGMKKEEENAVSNTDNNESSETGKNETKDFPGKWFVKDEKNEYKDVGQDVGGGERYVDYCYENRIGAVSDERSGKGKNRTNGSKKGLIELVRSREVIILKRTAFE